MIRKLRNGKYRLYYRKVNPKTGKRRNLGTFASSGGHEVVACLRRAPTTWEVRVVALSGYGQAEDRERGRIAGFDDHLVKPIDHPALLRCLTATEPMLGAR